MKQKHIHAKNSGTNSYFLPTFILFTLLGICLLMFQRQENENQNATASRAPLPTVTSIPLPETIEDIKAKCPKGECVHSCVAHVNDVIQQQEFVLPVYYGDEDADLVYYGISKTDELDKPRKFQVTEDLRSAREDTDAHKIIWSYLRELFPREIRPNLVTFGIYASATSDGKFDTTLTENWIMKINILTLDDAYYLSSALIHEYGHYLTLNETQMDGMTDEWGNCLEDSYYGCQPADAYLNLFYWKFWKDIYSEWTEIKWDSVNYESDIKLFYERYKDQFINDYAATDPQEDIAESWTTFILEPLPAGNSVADQKARFFYDFPELVELRYQIIKGICAFEGIPRDQSAIP